MRLPNGSGAGDAGAVFKSMSAWWVTTFRDWPQAVRISSQTSKSRRFLSVLGNSASRGFWLSPLRILKRLAFEVLRSPAGKRLLLNLSNQTIPTRIAIGSAHTRADKCH